MSTFRFHFCRRVAVADHSVFSDCQSDRQCTSRESRIFLWREPGRGQPESNTYLGYWIRYRDLGSSWKAGHYKQISAGTEHIPEEMNGTGEA